MFSKEFMRYLINYQPDGIEPKQQNSVKEIAFKSDSNGVMAKVYVTLNQK